jgi:hypothetical protein
MLDLILVYGIISGALTWMIRGALTGISTWRVRPTVTAFALGAMFGPILTLLILVLVAQPQHH